jgi:hypothetical protein
MLISITTCCCKLTSRKQGTSFNAVAMGAGSGELAMIAAFWADLNPGLAAPVSLTVHADVPILPVFMCLHCSTIYATLPCIIHN